MILRTNTGKLLIEKNNSLYDVWGNEFFISPNKLMVVEDYDLLKLRYSSRGFYRYIDVIELDMFGRILGIKWEKVEEIITDHFLSVFVKNDKVVVLGPLRLSKTYKLSDVIRAYENVE